MGVNRQSTFDFAELMVDMVRLMSNSNSDSEIAKGGTKHDYIS